MAARAGERHHLARLTPQMVVEARALFRAGRSFAWLINHYDHAVDEKTLRSAIRGATWAHLPGAVPLQSE